MLLVRRALVALVAAAAVALVAVAVAAVAAVAAGLGARRAVALAVLVALALVVVRAGLAGLAVGAGRAGVLALAGVVAVVVAVVVAAGEHRSGAADHERSGHHRDDQGPAHRGSPCCRAGLVALGPGHGGGLDPVELEGRCLRPRGLQALDHIVELVEMWVSFGHSRACTNESPDSLPDEGRNLRGRRGGRPLGEPRGAAA